MKRLSLEIAENTRLSMLYSAVQGFFQELISTVIFMFIAIYLAFQVKGGNILISEALFIVAAIVYIKNEGNNITSGIIEYRKILGAVSNLKEFLTPRIYSKQANLIESPVKTLEARNLFFSYGENKIFEDVNLKFNSGEFIVLTGDSGAGKTTFLDLCLRVKEPLQGNILYNGIDLLSVSEDCLRTKTALVEQEPFLFNGSISYNLSLIKNDISDNEIFETLELVNLVKYAKELKEGIDTDLGLLGSKVSVGQKQRLSIARIFLKNPDVIFLDEFTSNLDENNEEIVLDNLREFGKNKIIICTSHRNNVIKNADRTFIIKNYHLIEK
jgi:ABC-type multidrug transport system fused ATPase/permease subunit